MTRGEKLKSIVETIEGLKLQSEIALASNGENKAIDREKLSEAHSKMNSKILQDITLKKYMREEKIASYIDIDVEDFRNFYFKNVQ